MKNNKRILKILSAILMCSSTITLAYAEEDEISNKPSLTFTFHEEDHTATWTGIDGVLEESKLEVPSTVNEYTVTDIDLSSFNIEQTNVTELSLPDSLTKISNGSFLAFTKVNEITIPGSVETFNGSFEGCTSLTNIVFEDGVSEIITEGSVVSGLESLKEIHIPSSLIYNAENFAGKEESIIKSEKSSSDAKVMTANFDDDTDKQDDDAVAQIGNTKYSDLQSAIDAANDGETVILLKDVELTTSITISKKSIILSSDTQANTFYSIKRASDFTDASLIRVLNKGTLTLSNIVIDGQNVSITGKSGSLTASNNTVNIVEVRYATLNICDGTNIQNHNAYNSQSQHNAAVLIYDSTLNMTGGKVTNSSNRDGGGIDVEGDSTMNFSSGEVSNNKASTGGGIYVHGYETYANSETTAHLYMTGGTVTNNTATEYGGGITISYCAEANISAGYITNNAQTKDVAWGGGGIYVNGDTSPRAKGKLFIYNAEITGNSTTTTNEDYKMVFDSVISACPIGSVDISITDGAVIHDNSAKNTIVTYRDNTSGTITVSPIMLGGAPYNWTDLSGNPLSLDEIVWTNESTGYYHALTKVSTSTNTVSGLDRIKTYITGNTAVVLGAAIGTNGEVYIGKSDGDVTLKIKKEWDASVPEDEIPDSITVYVYATDGDGITNKVGFITLSKENDWTGFVLHLPKLDSDGKEYSYTISEDTDKYYSNVVINKLPDDDNDDSTEKYNIVLTNKKAGHLTVSKTVSGNVIDTTKKFSFTVTLSDTSISGTYGDITFEKGVASFKLSSGENVTALGLPDGVTYKVEESDNKDYTVTITVNDKVASSAIGKIESGKTSTVNFNNCIKITPTPTPKPSTPTSSDPPTTYKLVRTDAQ